MIFVCVVPACTGKVGELAGIAFHAAAHTFHCGRRSIGDVVEQRVVLGEAEVNLVAVFTSGNALLAVGVCTYSNTAITEVKDAEGNKVGELNVEKNTTADGEEQVIRYTGDATTLTFYFTATSYIHRIEVYNVLGFVDKDETTGYYIVPAGDAASLILTLKQIKAGEKIFLPNGVYDLGEKVLTEINKNNISIIGQSMEGTVIKNAPSHSWHLSSASPLWFVKIIVINLDSRCLFSPFLT